MTDPHPSDLVAQRAFLGEDDKRFRRDRTRRRAPKPDLPDLPDGPCCARCRHWEPPFEADDFGRCREAVVEIDGFADRRRVLTRAEAVAGFLFGVEPLPTRGFFAGCSLFAAIGEEEAT